MKYLMSLIALLVFVGTAQAVPVLGEFTDPFINEGPFYADNEPVRVKIDPALQGADVEQSFVMDVWFQNFTYQPDEAAALPSQYANGKRESQAGHFHVYGTLLNDNSTDPTSDDFWNYTNVFIGAPGATLIEPGHVQFDVNLPVEGLWQLRVEAQYDDHTFRVAPHPQNWNATDTVLVSAVPEPSTMLLLLGAAGCLLSQRPPRKYRR